MTTTPFHNFHIPDHLILKTGSTPDRLAPIAQDHIALLLKKVRTFTGLNILELGCGIGRDAIPLLSDHIGSGCYHGFDIDFETIQWCQQHITLKHPRARFHHLDVKNEWYNASGKHLAHEIPLAVETDSVDIVVLQSVFTHLDEAEIRFYLSEFRRVCHAGAILYFTCFLIDKEVLQRLRGTNVFPSFGTQINDYTWTEVSDGKTAAVAYTLDFFAKALAGHGFEMLSHETERGSWSLRTPTVTPDPGQDIIVARKL